MLNIPDPAACFTYQATSKFGDECQHCGYLGNKHLYCNERTTRRVTVYFEGRVQHEQLTCSNHLDRIMQGFLHPSETVVVTMVVGDEPPKGEGQHLCRHDQPTCGVNMINPANECAACGKHVGKDEFFRGLVEVEYRAGDVSYIICDDCR